MIISGIVSVNSEKIISCGLLVLGVVALHNLCGMGIGLGAAKLYISNITKPLRLQLKSECRTADLLFLLQPLILQQIHWLHFPERSSVYGIIYQALYLPESAKTEPV